MRRYAPFLALAAVQLLFIALAPTNDDGSSADFSTGFVAPGAGAAGATAPGQGGTARNPLIVSSWRR